MSDELLVDTNAFETRIALLRNGDPVEIHLQRPASDPEAQPGNLVGNIYLGKVARVAPAIQAAFVDIGTPTLGALFTPRDGTSRSGESGPLAPASLPADGEGTRTKQNAPDGPRAVREGEHILVQVAREPLKSHGTGRTRAATWNRRRRAEHPSWASREPGRTRRPVRNYSRNHYVPKWFQHRSFHPRPRNRSSHCLDLKPDTRVSEGGTRYTRNNLLCRGPQDAFQVGDLYATRVGTLRNTEIEQHFFGPIDREGKQAVDYFHDFRHPSANSDLLHAMLSFGGFRRHLRKSRPAFSRVPVPTTWRARSTPSGSGSGRASVAAKRHVPPATGGGNVRVDRGRRQGAARIAGGNGSPTFRERRG